jgi:biopolymer transport protein ExbD
MRRGLPEPAGERIPNLAPMVDVIMVLLIFFLLGASLDLIKEGVLQTELDPRSGPGAGAAVRVNPLIRIVLENADDGRGCNIYLNDTPFPANNFDALREELRRKADPRLGGADTSNPIVVGAQTNVRWKFVIKAMDAAVRAGFKNVQFAVSWGDTKAK